MDSSRHAALEEEVVHALLEAAAKQELPEQRGSLVVGDLLGLRD
jgi:hypothetical protein